VSASPDSNPALLKAIGEVAGKVDGLAIAVQDHQREHEHLERRLDEQRDDLDELAHQHAIDLGQIRDGLAEFRAFQNKIVGMGLAIATGSGLLAAIIVRALPG
jgi:hypothetical protein